MREARILAHVTHPGIVQVHDTGHTGYTAYIAMEYMARGSLMNLIDRREIDWTLVRRVVKEAGGALTFLHTRDVLHRDIKPGNILVSDEGVIKLGDFGLSRARLPAEDTEFTRSYSLMGTRQYMAPELLQGALATEATDQYAFGRSVLRLFEGREPVSPPRRLDEIDPSAPRAFADALARTMAIDPSARYPAMADACAALSETLPIDTEPS